MRHLRLSLLGLSLLAAAPMVHAQAKIPTTREVYGFTIGDDYRLANYTQFTDYVKKLDAASDRVTVQVDRQDRRGPRPAHGHHHLARQSQAAREVPGDLADASPTPKASPTIRRAPSPPKARRWCGSTAACTRPKCWARPSSPRPSTSSLSRNDAETLHILNDVIILATHANPDGMELVSNWYMKETDEKKRNSERHPAPLPEVHRPRQQPRLLHGEPAGDPEHQPPALRRVVPAGHVQPPPDRPDRRGDVRAALPRSVQLQLRSA